MGVEFQTLMKCYDLGAGNQNSEVYAEILTQARNKALSPMIGAGLSQWAYPLWGELLLKKAKLYGCEAEVKTKMDAGQYDEAAQVLEQEVGKNEFRNLMVQTFDVRHIAEKRGECPDYLSMLPSVFTGPVLTTNFDRVIEDIYPHELGTRVINPADAFDHDKLSGWLHSGSAFLVKLHGDVEDPGHIVLTSEGYNEVYGADPEAPDMAKPLPKTLAMVLGRNPLLFLGCSLSPDRICAIIKACAKGAHKHYALLPLPKETENKDDPCHPKLIDENGAILKVLRQRKRELQDMNIFPLWYPAEKHTESLTAFFTQLSKDLSPQPPDSGSKPTLANPRYKPNGKLYGRDADIRGIVSAMTGAEARVVWVEGPAGIGKTEVCKAVYRKIHGKYPDWEMPFVDVNGVDSLLSFYRAIYGAIEVDMPQTDALTIGNHLHSRLIERYSAGYEMPHPALYLDNWEDFRRISQEEQSQVLDWLDRLRESGYSLLFSSQIDEPEDFTIHKKSEIKPLDNAAAVETISDEEFLALDSVKLFLQKMNKDEVSGAELTALRKLIPQLAGHPLAIVLTATRAGKATRGIAQVLDRWDHIQRASSRGNQRHTSLDVALTIVWETVQHERDALFHWMLLYYSVQPIPLNFYDEELRGDIPQESWDEGRDKLKENSLLQCRDDGVSMLPPIKRQIKHLLPEEDELWTDGVICWAAGLILLLKKTNNRTDEENYLRLHHQALGLFPQLCNTMELMMKIKGADGENVTNKICELLNVAIEYLRLDVSSCELMKKLTEYDALQNRRGALAQAYQYYSEVLIRQGKSADSMQYLERAKKLYADEGDVAGEAENDRQTGMAIRRQGRITDAVKYYKKAKVKFQKVNDELGVAQTLKSYCEALLYLGKIDKIELALACLDDAERFYGNNYYSRGLANVYVYRADALAYCGKYTDAISLYEKAQKLFEILVDLRGEAYALKGQANTLLICGETSKALVLCEKSESKYKDAQCDLGLAYALISKGNIQSALDLDEESSSNYDYAEMLCKKVQEIRGQADIARGRGGLRLKKSRHGEAVDFYQKAKTLYEETEDFVGLTYACVDLYCCRVALGHHADADGLREWLETNLPSFPKQVRDYVQNKLYPVELLDETFLVYT